MIYVPMFSTYHLSNVFNDLQSRKDISLFIDNVLRQVPSKDFLNMALTIKSCDDKEFYSEMLLKVNSIKPKLLKYYQLQALRNQKKILSEQIKILTANKSEIINCMEIGNPAIYLQASSDYLNIAGKVYAIAESQNPIDFVQSFKFRPATKFVFYDQFIYLDNYAPISSEVVESNSLDLVICTIGLHHIPTEKLQPFIESIHRSLKPGGVFILREHDCTTPYMESLVFAAHSVFNSIVGPVGVLDEVNEYRNFRSLDYWVNLIESNGFEVGPERLLQEGDPTRNTLMKFIKKTLTIDDEVADISQNLKHGDPEYERPLIKTYLGSNEWFNVDVSQEYGNFINKTPFYEFPYFKSIAVYWKIFFNSWKLAAKKGGNFNVLKSDHTLMNIFIGVTMTVEYAAKGLLSLPVSILFKGEEPGFIKAVIVDPENQLSNIAPDVKVLLTKNNIKIISIPRYKAFLKFLISVCESKILIKEIAGQKEIQFKVRTVNRDVSFNEIEGCKYEYSWSPPSLPDEKITVLTVKINNISAVIKELLKRDVDILYVHDF